MALLLIGRLPMKMEHFHFYVNTYFISRPLWNNRLTNDIEYVPYVVTTTPFPFMNVTYRIKTISRICFNMSNTTGATCGAGFAYPSGAHEKTPSFCWGSCCLFFSFLCCVICTIVCLFVFFIYSHGVVS